MVCSQPTPKYLPGSKEGIAFVTTEGDGYTIGLDWTQAFPDNLVYTISYNIYFSTINTEVFNEGPKFVSAPPDVLSGFLLDFVPGDTFYFAVKATEYDPNWYNLNFLPDSNSPDFKVYPESLLLSSITDTDTSIPITDIDQFPNKGVIQIGAELIQYIAKDIPLNSLLVSQRGFLGTTARLHTPDGYDGIHTFDIPFVFFWKGFEDHNTVIYEATSAFKDPNYAFTITDGYKKVLKDNLTTDLSASDQQLQDFPPYDYSGYHRTDPVLLLSGECLDTYYGGERGCSDGYGVGMQVRGGLSVGDAAAQREEVLLSLDGEPVVLVKRLWKGIVCPCYEPTAENPKLRCLKCFGTGFVTGYEQYFDTRRSDGRIMVRFDPTEDDLRPDDDGLEYLFQPDCWTLAVPTVKDRDFLIRFNVDGTEEYRYKILNVTRNKLLFSGSGGQKFKAQRVRRTDPIYQWSAIRDTSTMPSTVSTTIGFLRGPNNTLLPHTHNVVINEHIVSLSQINQTTSVSEGHNHVVRGGIILDLEGLGHTHQIII